MAGCEFNGQVLLVSYGVGGVEQEQQGGAGQVPWRRAPLAPAALLWCQPSCITSSDRPLPRPAAVQVCSYRCITSYESQRLSDFSLCIIQKHNCALAFVSGARRLPGTWIVASLWQLSCELELPLH